MTQVKCELKQRFFVDLHCISTYHLTTNRPRYGSHFGEQFPEGRDDIEVSVSEGDASEMFTNHCTNVTYNNHIHSNTMATELQRKAAEAL